MNLQERYDAEKTAAAQLGQRYQQARAAIVQMEQEMIRFDARMALLEQLMQPQPAQDSPAEPLPFTKPRRKKAESDVA